MDMEPGSKSKQDSGVVNMTRAMEALSPWLNNPRRTIIQVEGRLVLTAATLLLLQLILGSCKRRWHKSIFNFGVQACNGIMFPLIIYTLGTMQSSPIKNPSYPVWAAFLIMASAGTTTVRQYDFCGRFKNKYIEVMGECLRDLFYVTMFVLLMNPNTITWKTALDPKRLLKNHPPRTSSACVLSLAFAVLFTKMIESVVLAILGYHKEVYPFGAMMKIICGTRTQEDAEWRMEESGNDGVCDSDDPQNMKGCKYAVCYRRLCRGGSMAWITIDQIWDRCGNSVYGKELKDLCLSCALSRRLVLQHYFGDVFHKTSLLYDHDFVFKKLLPSEGDFKRAFRIIEVELGFCYDFFFTKYNNTFVFLNSPVAPFIQSLVLSKIILVLFVGVFAIRKQLVLETPTPIIEVHLSEADYIITLLVLGIALMVDLVQAVFYLASNWAQVSLACMHVKKHWYEPSAFISGKAIGFLQRFMISGALRNKIDQRSFVLGRKQQPIEVSDAVKIAIARSLISTYCNNLNAIGETSLWQNQMFDEYSWALKNLSQLEVMLIWHIATEYCDASSDGRSDGNGTTPTSNHLGANLFGYVLQLIRPDPRRNSIGRDGHRGVAVHLSRYCAYLIQSVPELLPYHKADIAAVAQEVMEESKELYGSDYSFDLICNRMTNEEEDDDPRKMFQKGVKLGKQLVRMQMGIVTGRC